MKLYLSSYGLGNYPKELIKLTGTKAKIAIIGNASDGYNDKKGRIESIKRQKLALADIGLIPKEIDLRKYFNKKEKLLKKLKEFNAVWVKGGNVFVLLKAMKLSGFDQIIKKMLNNNEIVYAGFSAGWCVLSPTLHGFQFVDNPKEIPRGYPKKIDWKGLGLINYSPIPHYKSNHPESKAINDVVRYLKQNKIPFKTLRDGEIIIRNGNKEKIFRNKK